MLPYPYDDRDHRDYDDPSRSLEELDQMSRVEIQQLTDDDIREMGFKEYKPGYFIDDPRHPNFTAEDRYYFDHPGPPKITTKQPPRLVPNPKVDAMVPAWVTKWDDEQFSGQTLASWNVRPDPRVHQALQSQTKPVQSGEAARIIQDDEEDQRDGRKIGGLWVCKVCRKNFALWPSERAWRREIYGLRLTIVFRAPIACSNCRIMRQAETQRLGHEEYRMFWKSVIALYEGESPPTGPRWLKVWVQRRNRILNRFSRVFFGAGRVR